MSQGSAYGPPPGISPPAGVIGPPSGAGGVSGGPPCLETIATMAMSGNKGLNLGPQIIGLAMDSFLCGIMIHQFICWLNHSKAEKKHVKWLLIWSIVTATATTCFTWAWIFHLYVYNFGSYAPFFNFTYLGLYNILDNATIVAVQIFFAERAYVLNKRNKLLLLAILLCLGLSVAGAVGSTGLMETTSYLSDDSGPMIIFVYMTPSAAAATDLLITGSIVWGLAKNRNGWSDTDALLKKLIVLTIEAQVPGTLITIGALIEVTIKYRCYVGAFFQIIMAKPYILGFLAVLNSRDSWRRQGISSGGREKVFGHPSGSNHQDTVIMDSVPFSDPYGSKDDGLKFSEITTSLAPGDQDEERSIGRREKEYRYL